MVYDFGGILTTAAIMVYYRPAIDNTLCNGLVAIQKEQLEYTLTCTIAKKTHIAGRISQQHNR